MISRKSLLIAIILPIFVSNVSMAVMCARLKHVSGGEDHTLALMDDGTLWACGDNSDYQLGLGSSVSYTYSLQQVLGEDGVGYLQNIVIYDAGWFHSLATDANGTLWSWGNNTDGQLGNGSGLEDWDVPRKVHGVNDVGCLSDTIDIVYVSAGRSGKHSLAVDANGYVYAWGLDDYGQCGDGADNNDKTTPVLVLDDDPETDDAYLGNIATIIAVDAGVDHSIALDDDGFVWEWGGNNGYSYPQKVPGVGGTGDLNDIIGISTCGHSLAVDSNGFVYEWRNGNPYRVTDGDMNTASAYLEDIVEVRAGNEYSMARTSDGYVLYWNYGGSPVYIEDGDMNTQTGLLEGIISIGAGYEKYHMLAICQNGYGWAWGTNNAYGKFGVGDNQSHPEPTQMLCAEASSSIYLTKTSEIQGSEPNCARPFIEDNYLVYEICYGNPITNPSDPNYFGTVHDVNIIDHLPLEVDFNSVTGGGEYDGNTRTVMWTIGELAPGESMCLTLTTKVNNYARPGGKISNFVEMTADMYYFNTTDTVPVCNWGSEIIYVDQDANGGFNNGTCWDDAYIDLRGAFTGAENLGADVTAIWVAEGTYQPVYDTNETSYKDESFNLVEDVGVFGHFGGVGTYEISTSQRVFSDSNNTTILEGQIGQNSSDAVRYVIKAEGIDDGLVDGFTVRGSYNGAGIYLDSSDISVVNCKLKDNYDYGIHAKNYSYPDIHNCLFLDNARRNIYAGASQPDVSYCTIDGNDNSNHGVYLHSGSTSNISNTHIKDHAEDGIYGSNVTITLTSSKILGSNDNGIEGSNSDVTVEKTVLDGCTDNGIYLSSYSDIDIDRSVVRNSGEHGIYLYENSETSITNNWIYNNGKDQMSNRASGIYFYDQVGIPLVRNNTIYDNYTYGIESSENGADPNIINCIIYGNDSNDLYRENDTFDTVNFCCLQNPHGGNGNITVDPWFYDASSDNYHLDPCSACIDAGDPNGSYGDETDIDGETRMFDGDGNNTKIADMGADEFYWSPADFNHDGIVDFTDYARFADPWGTSSGDPNYDDTYDLINNNSIDNYDLERFCEDWLWEPAWTEGVEGMMMMGGGRLSFAGGFTVY